MTSTTHAKPVEAIRECAHVLRGAPSDFDPVLDLVGDAQVVLIGEASHGTHEFYRIRGEVTKRLIREKGFTAIAVEADWPDAYRVNRYVRGVSATADAGDALDGFRRFPQWMWRNADVLDFCGWLRAYNDAHAGAHVGFYGLDLYSLHTSIEAVLAYLRMVDPAAADRARERYACFEPTGEDLAAYGYATTLGLTPSCEREVVDQLLEIRHAAARYVRQDGRLSADALFYAEQNARLVANAEAYYRAMVHDHVQSWNLRDRHMAETLEALRAYLARAKVVVWAHNSHVGDARATQMGRQGELNIGQIVRQHHGDTARSIGFTTYAGTVTAAADWGAPAERRRVRPALPESWEGLFHQTGLTNFMLDLRAGSDAAAACATPRLERAIGVIYRPQTERQSHYFQADLPRQFDAVLHYDETRAVEPLERTAVWVHGEPAETYPSGI